MGKHNLRRIVNLQKWEPMINQYVNSLTGKTPQSNGENVRADRPSDNGSIPTSRALPYSLSPEVLKRDLEQLEQLKYRKLK